MQNSELLNLYDNPVDVIKARYVKNRSGMVLFVLKAVFKDFRVRCQRLFPNTAAGRTAYNSSMAYMRINFFRTTATHPGKKYQDLYSAWLKPRRVGQWLPLFTNHLHPFLCGQPTGPAVAQCAPSSPEPPPSPPPMPRKKKIVAQPVQPIVEDIPVWSL